MTSTSDNAATTAPTTVYKTIEDLIGPKLYIQKSKPAGISKVDGSGCTIESCTTQSVLMKKKKHVEYVLLYFSASWCPPCQSFTPVLADFYQQYKDTMEIIYVSSDRDIEEFVKYYTSKMQFSTLHPFDANASDVTTTLRKNLSQVFQITGIPTLVVLHIPQTTGSSEKGNGIQFVTDQGRVDLLNHRNQFDLVWKKWKATPLLSIEEGVALSKRGDGSIVSMIMKLISTVLQNPLYIVGLFYIYRFYGKSIYRMMISNNSTTVPDPAMFEPIPDDEF